jgi:hypothetical protein
VVRGVDVAFAAGEDLGCDNARASLTGCKDNVVGKATADAMEMTTGLRAEGGGLLGGVGSIEAIVIVMLNLTAGVLDGVRCSKIVDAMLGDTAKGK